jgi:hypothetical protein
MPTRVVSGKSKLMRVELCIGILSLRALMDAILFYGEENVLIVRETASTDSDRSFEACFGIQPFVNLKCRSNL